MTVSIRPRVRAAGLCGALLALAAGSLGIALASGSGEVGISDLFGLFSGDIGDAERLILLELRLPRALAAFGTGAALALAGALMQVLLRNPLADPYILGSSGGAAAFALGAMLLGAGTAAVSAGAFAGALFSTVLVFVLASGGQWAAGRLLLTGVVVAAGWSALVSVMLAISAERNLRGALYWLMGDFAFAEQAGPVLAAAAVGVIASFLLGRSLNVLATGDQQAALLGLPVRAMRIGIYCLSALLTALAVTTAGTVGFVGLVVPHLVRLVAGADHRVVVPAATLAGGSLLVLADTLSRTLLAPRQLPVGAITALVGVPLFLVLLGRGRREAG
ncbi:MAG: iron ABC transporter permease [Gammaproteobacteria bacterium]|nr:iron ABC transporter permease [Gammaproteobacteria bacterium]